jgi:hypothetical protein
VQIDQKPPLADKIGVVRDHRWVRASEQVDRLGQRCRLVVSLGGGSVKQVDLESLVQLSRPGTLIELVHAFLLAEPKRKRLSGGMRRDFRKALAVLEKRGATVVDVTADIGSNKRKAFLAVVDADIGRSNRGLASEANGHKSKRGRKTLHFTAQQLKDAKAIWRNTKDYPDWEAAQAAFDADVPGFTVHRAFKAWRGRL